MTFQEYGVCRDKAALLVSMLREAGLDAYPVLISVGVKTRSGSADPDFNHAIVSVELERRLSADGPDRRKHPRSPAGRDCDQSYLVCRPEGESLKISPVQPPEDNLLRVLTTGTLTPTAP